MNLLEMSLTLSFVLWCEYNLVSLFKFLRPVGVE